MGWQFCIIVFCLFITHVRGQENDNLPESIAIQTPTMEFIDQAETTAIPSPTLENISQPESFAIQTPAMEFIDQAGITAIPSPTLENLNQPKSFAIQTPTMDLINEAGIPAIPSLTQENINQSEDIVVQVPDLANFKQPEIIATDIPTLDNVNLPETVAIQVPNQESVNQPVATAATRLESVDQPIATSATRLKNINPPELSDASSESEDSEEFFANTFSKTLGKCGIFSREETQDFKELALIMKRSLGSSAEFERAPPQVLKALADSFASAVAERTAADISHGDLYSKMTCVLQALTEGFLFTTGVNNSYFTNEVEKLIKAFFLRGDDATKILHQKHHHHHQNNLLMDPSPDTDDLSNAPNLSRPGKGNTAGFLHIQA